jgi:membrane protein required for colicin V production
MADFTWFDYILFLIFFLNTILGFARGVSKEIISFLSLVIALFIAVKFTTPIANVLTTSQGAEDVLAVFTKYLSYNGSGSLNSLAFGLSFLILFLGIFFTGEAAIFYANIELFLFPFSVIGRLLGAALGFVRGYVLDVVLLLILQLTSFPMNNAWEQSYFVPRLMPQVTKLAGLIVGFPV